MDKKITELTELDATDSNDVLAIVDDPAGNPITKKVKISTIDHDQLANFVANEHIDWTADQGATNIHSGNYTNTTYTAGTGMTLDGTEFDCNITQYTDADAVSAVATADDYLKNDANDTTTGILTAASYVASGSSGTSAQWDTAYTHSQDNSQAHSDYMLNTGDTATGDYTFDTNTLHIDSTNNRVGIGTASPDAKLDISANNTGLVESDPVNVLRFTDTDISSAANQRTGQIEFYSSDKSPNPAGVHSRIYGMTSDTSGSGNLVFETGTTGSASEKVRITDAGNVGIGTASPDEALHVSGSIKATANLTDGTNTLTIANAKTAYTHSQDNTQAHSDYLLNSGDDTTSGTITAAGFNAGSGTIQTTGTTTTGDHGTAATDEVVNVCYGTGDPPEANTTTEGTLFVKYVV